MAFRIITYGTMATPRSNGFFAGYSSRRTRRVRLDFELAIRLLDADEARAENTCRGYAGQLRRYAAWLDGRHPTDRTLAEYLDAL